MPSVTSVSSVPGVSPRSNVCACAILNQYLLLFRSIFERLASGKNCLIICFSLDFIQNEVKTLLGNTKDEVSANNIYFSSVNDLDAPLPIKIALKKC